VKHKIFIVPHTHYDAEVFLVEKETLEIGYANLVGALKLMRTNPAFKFVLDQTCYIEPFLKTYPEERDFFQQMVDAGRLEISGGMVAMPDVNIPSGESFIRQILYGKQYCQDELGVDVRLGWTIDTFGHHPQIPQLMAKCGFDYTAFQRLMKRGSPSEFLWQGLDGTRLFCHWMAGSYGIFYGSPGNLFEFRKFVEERVRYLEAHAVTPNLMMCAGGDLTAVDPQMLAMIEAYNRSQDENELYLATPSEFFKAVKDSAQLPVVEGDLNPAFQGCYSARIDIKQWNRKVETLLSNVEKFDALASRFGAAPQAKPLKDAWKGVLFNQFHDIICGSHVDAAFFNTIDRYKYAAKVGEDCLDASLQTLADQIDTRGARGDGTPVIVFNPLSWDRSDAVEAVVAFSRPGTFELGAHDSSGKRVPSDLLHAERYEDGSLKRAKLLFIARDVPAFGYEVYHIAPAREPAPTTDLVTSHPYNGPLRFELDHGSLENAFCKLEFDLWSGAITSLYDKVHQWEALPERMRLGNIIVKEQDYGNFWQYNGPCKGDEFYPVEGRYPLPAFDANQADFSHQYNGDGNIHNGNARVEFVIGFPFGSGTFATRVRLYAGLPRIDIQTTLVNNDEKVRYRVAFPTRITGGSITHEIPFGAIQRPEGEFPAQNWIDYTGDKQGLTLLNRGLPGNNVVDGVMMLSLLKCTALEGGYSDMKLGDITREGLELGKTHTFDYALVLHDGDWRQSQAYRQGAEFNNPLIVWKPAKKAGSLPARKSFIRLSAKNVVLSAVKACPGGMVIRVYEAEGQPVDHVVVETAWPVKQAFEVNLIEKEEKKVPLAMPTNQLDLALGPFEIRTIKLILLQ
jgi:alpha-mannosidase